MQNVLKGRRSALLKTASVAALIGAGLLSANPASAIVINTNYTTTTDIDTSVNWTGVGQMVVDEQNGFIGLCTATLINPRTVIFASHCVNENPSETAFMPATGYGVANGGLPIGFFFNTNNNQAGNSAIGQWLNGIAGGPKDLTRTVNGAYNSNFVVYDTNCCTIGLGNNFLQSDVAMAALDTPAVGIPTWTTLFSPLSAPVHAEIAGYGTKGTGTGGGNGGIDFRRRVAENIVSFLGSLDDQDTFLFGGPDGLPANLYMLDFNDPKFNTAQANVFDFNIFHDRATTKEGITAPGDSGGPLIIDGALTTPGGVPVSTIAAVLSGGDRFFNAQPGSSYGTTSFYQPLYLYWDWIVANNPYKYVGAKAGNGNWTDPTHWVMNLDPNYLSLDANGHVINALPTTPALGQANIPPGFGEVCYFDICENIVTGAVTNPTSPAPPNPPGSLSSGPAVVSDTCFASDPATVSATACSTVDPSSLSGGSILSSDTNPAVWTNPENSGTVGGQSIQGLPGTTLTTAPNDTNGNAATGAPARYYDVTLAAAGTTTLSGATIAIDRLTIDGPSAGLTIASNASLWTLIDTTMWAGNLEVDGTLNSIGDIALFGGVLTGGGTVNAPFTTAVIANIVPGTAGTVGTLSFGGSLILSTGSTTWYDVAAASNDKLAVAGSLSVGGSTAVFSFINGYSPKFGDSAVIATASSITGIPYTPDTIAGALRPTVTSMNTVGGQELVLSITADSFLSQFSSPSSDQTTIAQALDSDRTHGGYTGGQAGLYAALDPLMGAPLGAGLESLAPDDQRAIPAVANLQVEGFGNMVWQHLDEMGGGSDTGASSGFHVNTQSLKLAMASQTDSSPRMQQLFNMGLGISSNPGSDSDATHQASLNGSVAQAADGGDKVVNLPGGMSGFLVGSVLDGTAAIGGGGGTADLSGFVIGTGVDVPVGDGFEIGGAGSIAQTKATLRSLPSSSQTNSTQGAVYARYTDGDFFAGGFLGAGSQSISTNRIAVVGATSFMMTGHTSGSSPMAGIEAGQRYGNALDTGLTLIPTVGFQYIGTSIDGYTETGGAAAMTFNAYSAHSLIGHLAVDATGSFDMGNGITMAPMVHAAMLGDFGSGAGSLTGFFAGTPTGVMAFGLTPTDRQWFELGAGSQFMMDGMTLSVRYDATTSRRDVSYSSWTAKLDVPL
jgi:uncharacterized protein with beta-barrel porin domain